MVFSARDLPLSILNYANDYPRGFGYWLWKPFLCYKFCRLATAECCIYLDARCAYKSEELMAWIELFSLSNFDICAWSMDHISEFQWSSSDIINLVFPELLRSHEPGFSPQFAATFFAFKCTSKMKAFFKEWYLIMQTYPDLSRDGPYLLANQFNFRDNRFDQSVFSLLIKRMFSLGLLDVCALSNSTIYSPSFGLIPHAQPHRGDYAFVGSG